MTAHCPECGGRIGAHSQFRSFAAPIFLRCSSCGAVLHADRAGTVATAIAVSGIAMTAMLLVAARLGLLQSLPRILLATMLAAVVGTLLANAWTLRVATLRTRGSDFLHSHDGSRYMTLCGSVAVSMLVVFCCALLYVTIGAALARRAPTDRGSTATNEPSEKTWSWRLWTPDGRGMQLSELRGRPIFLNVFATWCAPCVGELPSIQALFDSLGGSDAAFVVVSEESADTVRSFFAARSFTVPVYVSDHIPSAFRTDGIPATFVLSPDGGVALRHVGADDWDRDDVRELLRP